MYIYIYIYIYICGKYCLDFCLLHSEILSSKKVNDLLRKYEFFLENISFPRKLSIRFENILFSFENIICSKTVNYLLRKSDYIRSGILFVPRKFIICFGDVIYSFENTSVSKSINYLLGEYDGFVGNMT